MNQALSGLCPLTSLASVTLQGAYASALRVPQAYASALRVSQAYASALRVPQAYKLPSTRCIFEQLVRDRSGFNAHKNTTEILGAQGSILENPVMI